MESGDKKCACVYAFQFARKIQIYINTKLFNWNCRRIYWNGICPTYVSYKQTEKIELIHAIQGILIYEKKQREGMYVFIIVAL